MTNTYASKMRLKDLALVCLLRSKHSNSIFYNPSYRSLSHSLNVSTTYLRSALRRLECDGWVVFEKGNMRLVRQKKVSKSFSISHLRNFEVDASKGLDGVLDELRREILSSKWLQKDHRCKVRGDKKLTGLSSKYLGCENPYVNTVGDSLQISYKGLGKLLGVSKTSAFYIMRRWIEKGYFGKRNLVRETNLPKECVKYGGDETLFVKGGRVFKQMPNLYITLP